MEKINICEGVNLTFIPGKKFKNSGISFTMFTPLCKEEAAKNTVLCGLLSRSCAKYPSFTELNKKLEELYGASLESSVAKLGDIQALTLSACSINDVFSIDSESIFSETTKLLCEMIFNPDLSAGTFKEENFNQEKREVIEALEAEYNDKKKYAAKRCEKLMCGSEKFGISKYGEIEDIKELTPKEVFKSWEKLLKTAKIEIIIIGSAAWEPIAEEFKKRFSNIKREKGVNLENEVIKKAGELKSHTDNAEVVQSKLVMGFRTDINNQDDSKKINAMRLSLALFGGTVHSKLFLNVREKLSLCYYCSAEYNSHKGIMFVQSGVEKKNIEKAKEEILKQLEDVKLGNFTDEDLKANRMAIIQSIEKTNDSLSALANFYISKLFSTYKQTPEEVIKDIKEITKDEIMRSAEKISLDTIYELTSKDQNNKEDNL